MKKITLFAVLLCISVLSHAQLYPSKLGFMGSVVFHLGEKRLQAELNMSDSQAESVRGILADHGREQARLSTKIQSAKSDQYAGIQAEMEKLESATAAKLSATLTVDQRARAQQLALQDVGPFALRNASVASKVGLTPDQRSKIESIAQATVRSLDEMNAKMGAELEAAGTGKTGNAKRTKIVNSYDAKGKAVEHKGEIQVLALLSAQQRAKWSAALGKPFKL
jgi:hypothetical protein